MKLSTLAFASSLIFMTSNSNSDAQNRLPGDYPARTVMNFLGKNICLEIARDVTRLDGGKSSISIETKFTSGSDSAAHTLFVDGVGHVSINEAIVGEGDCDLNERNDLAFEAGKTMQICLPSQRNGRRILVKIAIKSDVPSNESILQRVVHSVASCEVGGNPGFYQPGDKLKIDGVTLLHPPLDWQKPLSR